MATIELNLDDRELRRHIRALGDREIGRAMSTAMNRTAYDIVEAEYREAKRAFRFHSSATQTFVAGRPSRFVRGRDTLAGAGAWQTTRARPDRLIAAVQPRKGASKPAIRRRRLLRKQQRGDTVTAFKRESLVARRKVAVPVEAEKTPSRGIVKRSDLPRVLLGKRGKGFVAGRALLKRIGPKRSDVQVMFALAQSIRVQPRFEFFRAARNAVDRNWNRKAVEEFRKIRFGR